MGRFSVPNSDERGGRFSEQFTVAQDCDAQTLSLVARASDDIMGVTGQILQAQLLPTQLPEGNQP
jgi:hypothetical protein